MNCARQIWSAGWNFHYSLPLHLNLNITLLSQRVQNPDNGSSKYFDLKLYSWWLQGKNMKIDLVYEKGRFFCICMNEWLLKNGITKMQPRKMLGKNNASEFFYCKFLVSLLFFHFLSFFFRFLKSKEFFFFRFVFFFRKL